MQTNPEANNDAKDKISPQYHERNPNNSRIQKTTVIFHVRFMIKITLSLFIFTSKLENQPMTIFFPNHFRKK